VPDRTGLSPEATFNAARMAFSVGGSRRRPFGNSIIVWPIDDDERRRPNFDIGAVPTAMTTHEDYLRCGAC